MKHYNTVSGKHPERIRILYTTKLRAIATLDTRFQGGSLNVLKILCSNLVRYPLHNHKCYKSSCVHNSLLSNSILINNCVPAAMQISPPPIFLKLVPFQSFCLLVSFERTSAHSMLIRFSSV